MNINYQRITIIKFNKPAKRDINRDLQWFGSSLGLFNLRDKDKSCFRIFIDLLKSSKSGRQISSDEVAAHLNLTRGTVVHHLNRLMETGLVVNQKNRYFLRVENLEYLMDEIEKDINRTLSDLKEIAKSIDLSLGLEQ
ncbi:MAG: winged helix-turn-helix transcriptional regulator [archaeon]